MSARSEFKDWRCVDGVPGCAGGVLALRVPCVFAGGVCQNEEVAVGH